MGLRVNSAIWMEKYNRWQIKVRKDGKRRTFTCPIPGRVGQRECQKKADAWMDEGIANSNTKVSRLYDHWINELKISTSKSNWLKYEGFGRNYIKPQIGMKKMSSINSGMLQDVILYS
ncbi:MAG: hypothetical protein RR612_09295, partial [Oscillospiraceae bacterium]